ncbi:MAG: restriction endonuclease, SacI family [Terracidiphilus sp.]
MPKEPYSPDVPEDSPAAPAIDVPSPAKAKPISEVLAECNATLEKHWAEVKDRADTGNTSDYIEDEDLLEAIEYSLNCKQKGYHYVLLTQLMAKVDDPGRDCRALQDQALVPGAFDARTIAHSVSVKFDRGQLDGALGRSPSPYLINSIRAPLLDENDGKKRGDKVGWRRVCQVAAAVENRNDPEFTAKVFRQVLLGIYRKLGSTTIKYNVPLRSSLAQVIGAIRKFTAEKSGGDRPLAITAALFETFGKHTKLFEPTVRRGRINASDESSGQVADVECVDAQGTVVIAVEVKDKTVTVSDLEEKLGVTRERGIKEVFFVSGRGKKEAEDVPARVAKEFAAGQNLYVCNLVELTESVLALTGEASRRDFLIDVGEQLDKYSDTKHRLAWKIALDEMSNA